MTFPGTPEPASAAAFRTGAGHAVRRALDLLAVGLLVLFLLPFVQRNELHQGDLKTYLLAAHTLRAGKDPYSPANLDQLAGRRVLPFVYPAVALVPFAALATLPPKAAASVWMWGKIVALGLLVLLWWRRFAPRAGILPLALVAVFGWNQSALWDLSAGNVAILEAALLWSGFACFVAGRRAWFAALVVAASCFKLTPAVFLLLLLAPDANGRASPRLLVIAGASLALVVGLPLLVGPSAHWVRFWSAIPDASDYGAANPSGLGLAVVAAARLGMRGALGYRLPRLVFASFAPGLSAVSLRVTQRAWRAEPRRLVMVAVFLYVLLSPRPMAYGFALLTPAPFYFSPRPFQGRTGALLLACLLCAQGFSRAVFVQSSSLLFLFAPFLLSLCLWLLAIQEDERAAGEGARAGADGSTTPEAGPMAA